MKDGSEIDALFRLPLDEFTAARNVLAARLKKEKRAIEAARVKALGKPTASAWVVNQLYWKHSKDFERLLAIAGKVRTEGRRTADFRALSAKRRAVIAELLQRAGDILAGAGHGTSPEVMRRVSVNLETLASQGGGKRIEPGRLTGDLEPLGFDALAALFDAGSLAPANVLPFPKKSEGGGKKADGVSAQPQKARSEQARAEKAQPEKATAERTKAEKARAEKEKAEKARAEKAKAEKERALRALQDAENLLSAARQTARRAGAVLEKAEARESALEEKKREIESQLSEAQADSRAAAAAAKDAAQAVAAAERALARAKKELGSPA